MAELTDRVWAEIDLDAVAQNLRLAQIRVGPDVGVMAVVKSNAYGHGGVEVARAAVAAGAGALGVATVAEGVELRQAGIDRPVVVIGSCLEAEVEQAVAYGVSLSLSPRELLWPIAEAARRLGRIAPVHLLVDTGMSRDGVRPDEALDLAELAHETDGLRIEGTYTHLATSLEADKAFCYDQIGRLRDVLRTLRNRNVSAGMVHAASSGGLFTLPGSHFDLVRQGITLYGVAPSEQIASTADLAPAMTVKTRVLSVRDLPAGESVGYGRLFTADTGRRVATLAMGYADGLPLGLSTRGRVLIHGREAPIVGRVMMDCSVVDVTRMQGVTAGDEVVVIGRSGQREITANEIAELCGTSPYEVLCGLGPRVRRIYRSSSALQHLAEKQLTARSWQMAVAAPLAAAPGPPPVAAAQPFRAPEPLLAALLDDADSAMAAHDLGLAAEAATEMPAAHASAVRSEETPDLTAPDKRPST
jgi:alanine racemase